MDTAVNIEHINLKFSTWLPGYQNILCTRITYFNIRQIIYSFLLWLVTKNSRTIDLHFVFQKFLNRRF